jgi:hypothetical protein
MVTIIGNLTVDILHIISAFSMCKVTDTLH